MRKELRTLTKELTVQGFSHRRTRRGHLLVLQHGHIVAGFAGTPSDHRSWRNSQAQLRRAGYRTTQF